MKFPSTMELLQYTRRFPKTEREEKAKMKIRNFFSHDPETREDIFSRAYGICEHCHTLHACELDHIAPIVWFRLFDAIGIDVGEETNLQALCWLCHDDKAKREEIAGEQIRRAIVRKHGKRALRLLRSFYESEIAKRDYPKNRAELIRNGASARNALAIAELGRATFLACLKISDRGRGNKGGAQAALAAMSLPEMKNRMADFFAARKLPNDWRKEFRHVWENAGTLFTWKDNSDETANALYVAYRETKSEIIPATMGNDSRRRRHAKKLQRENPTDYGIASYAMAVFQMVKENIYLYRRARSATMLEKIETCLSFRGKFHAHLENL